MKTDKQFLDDGKCVATFNEKTKTFIDEKSADQWLLKLQGEYLITRQPHIKKTLSLDEIDDGIWVEVYHNTTT